MADTYSDQLRIRLQEDGANSSTWGSISNTNFELFESSISGLATIATTGGTSTLTTTNGGDDEARHAMLKITGVLVSNSTIVVPAKTKEYLVWNATTGDYTVTIKTAAGTGVFVPRNGAGFVFCDATNVYNASRSATDSTFTIYDETDPTKAVAFQVSGVTTATTRTLTVPDANGTVMLTSAIGTTVQAYDADLTTWAGVTPGTGIATALAVNVGTAGAPVINGGVLGTPSSGTLTNATGLPVAGITASTSTALGVGSIELGHASDTTLTRPAAGRLQVEGNEVYTAALGAMGLRNKIINGGCQIAQRGTNSTTPASNTPTYGGCDRIFGMHSNASSWSQSQATGQPFSTNYGQQLTLTTPASGNTYHGQRIEAANSLSLASKTVTISATVWHNVGSNVSVTIRPARANSADNFAATTTYATSGAFTVATSTYTTITQTVTLDANAVNGVQVLFDFAFTGAITSKAFIIGDVQLEEGSVATPFEQRPYGLELALCQRYYWSSFPIGTAPAQNTGVVSPIQVTSQAANPLTIAVVPWAMRAAPSVVTTYNKSAADSNWSSTQAAAVFSTDKGAAIQGNGTWAAANRAEIHLTASAEL